MKLNTPTLGRGLKSLVGEESLKEQSYIPNLDIERVVPNSYQPRMFIDDEKLNELAASIKESGVIEPLIVTKQKNGNYELIAGERRWRASKLAGVKTVPVVVKEASAQQMLELAIVENVQRADLNPLEEALAFQHLVEDFNMTPSQIANKVGFSASLVSNKMRLLSLPEVIKKSLLEDKISEGHARALLGLRDSSAMLLAHNKILTQHLSVRATEELVRRLNIGSKNALRSHELIFDKLTERYESTLKSFFNTEKVRLTRSKKGGKIELKFKNDDELYSIIQKLGLDE